MSSGTTSVARARACLVLAAVLWSLGSVFMRLLREPLGLGLHKPQLTPLQIAFYRGLFGGFVVLALGLAIRGYGVTRSRPQRPPSSRKLAWVRSR